MMSRENPVIQNLFLIRGSAEHQCALRMAELQMPACYKMLTIKDDYPYMVDDCAGLEGVLTWEQCGMKSFGFSRYWLDEYKSIEEVISLDMSGDRGLDSEIIQSPYFKFNLVWLLGRQYYDPIHRLNEFILNQRPASVYFNPGDTFISYLVLSFAKLYNITCGKLNP